MYAPGPGWAPGGAATGQEWGYIRELRFSSRFLNDVTLVLSCLLTLYTWKSPCGGRGPVDAPNFFLCDLEIEAACRMESHVI